MTLHQQTFAPSGDSLTQVFDFLARHCDELAIGADLRLKLQLAAEELFTNIIKYAGDPQGAPVLIGLQRLERAIDLTIEDHGAPFNPFEQTAGPSAEAALEDRKVGGLGLLLVQSLASATTYRRVGETNCVRLSFALTGYPG